MLSSKLLFKIYQCAVSKLESEVINGNEERLLKIIKDLSLAQVDAYIGVLNDPVLEQKLVNIGQSFEMDIHNDHLIGKDISKDRKVLHVATKLYHTGGHTRVMCNWINQDTNTESTVFLTAQKSIVKPLEQIKDKVDIVFSEEKLLLEKSKELRNFILRNKKIDFKKHNIIGHEVSRKSGLDIDDKYDFEIAKLFDCYIEY